MQSYDLTAGNSCKACPSGYSCRGGLYCPDKSSVTCSAGYYLKANATSCSACGGNNYYCPGGTFNVSSSAQGRNTVSSGYYSTGGTSTTRTGQAQCTGATYCTGGVKYNCPTGYDDNTRNGKYRSSQCQINCSAGYYLASQTDPACTAVGIGYYKGAHLVSYGSASTRSACPPNYTTSSTTAGTSINRCYLSVDGGYVRDGSTGSILKRCSNGTYRGAHNEYYGTTYTCTSCPDYYSNSAAGSDEITDCYRFVTEGKYIASRYATTETTCPAGYYCTGTAYYGGYGTNRGGLYICTGATYSTSGRGSCLSCPTGYDKNTQSGKTSASQCLLMLSPGQYIASAGDSTAETCLAGYYCPGDGVYYGGYGTNNGGMYICDGAVYSAAGAGACANCPPATSGWTRGEGVGWTDNSSCYQYRDATSISSYCTSGQLRQYGSSSSNTWGTVTEYTAFRAEAGAYVSGSGINMTCAQCGVGTYSSGGDIHACTACPTVTSGFEYGNITGMTSYTQCMQQIDDVSRINQQCSSGTIRQYADSATSWGLGTMGEEITAAPGAILDSRVNSSGGLQVTGEYDVANLCTECGIGEYSAGGNVKECTACPELTPGFMYNRATGMSSYTECVQATTDPGAANSNCMADPDASQVAVIHTAGSATSWGGSVLAVGVVAKPGAILDSNFQNGTLYVEGRYSLRLLCTQCGTGEYSAGGTATSCTACLDNYTTTGDALTDHDSASDCKIYCDGGSYIAVANATQCSNVGAGYWAPSSTIPQGSVGSRTACESGLTTIGSGAGADEAGDCGRVLNVGDEKIYLRSTKKTTPSLNISINGDVFYGNMSTATKGSLRINSGGTTYSVYDDSM